MLSLACARCQRRFPFSASASVLLAVRFRRVVPQRRLARRVDATEERAATFLPPSWLALPRAHRLALPPVLRAGTYRPPSVPLSSPLQPANSRAENSRR